MDGGVELVSFVARAESRIAALRALDDDPMTRPDLQEATGIPRATLTRILADFRDRDLVRRVGHEYRLTPLGNRIAAELSRTFDAVDAMQALQRLADWIPLEELAGTLDDLTEVTVTNPTPVEPNAPLSRAAEVIESADRIRLFCYSVDHAPILATFRGVTEQEQEIVGVVAEGVLEVCARDPELVDAARELFTATNAQLHVYAGDRRPQLLIVDGRTLFVVTDDHGAVQGLLEIDDDTVLPWAEETFQAIVGESRPVDTDAVTELLTT